MLLSVRRCLFCHLRASATSHTQSETNIIHTGILFSTHMCPREPIDGCMTQVREDLPEPIDLQIQYATSMNCMITL